MKRTVSLLGVILAGVATNLSAQTAAPADEVVTTSDKTDVPDYRPFTVGVEIGTASPGPSLAGSWRFTDHLGARVGVGSLFGVDVDIGNHEIEGINYDVTLKQLYASEQLALDFYPWKKSTFRVTAGVLLSQNPEVEGVMPQAPVFGQTFVTIGGNSYDSANIGDVNMNLEPNLAAPFVSIGMTFYLDHHKRWSLGGELGVAYTGNPDVTMSTSSGLVPQSDLDAEANQIEDGAWKFYPIVKLSVNYSF